MKGFQETQRRLTAHLRDPEANPAPEGVEDRRLGIYRRLVFGNLSRLLGGPELYIKRDDLLPGAGGGTSLQSGRACRSAGR